MEKDLRWKHFKIFYYATMTFNVSVKKSWNYVSILVFLPDNLLTRGKNIYQSNNCPRRHYYPHCYPTRQGIALILWYWIQWKLRSKEMRKKDVGVLVSTIIAPSACFKPPHNKGVQTTASYNFNKILRQHYNYDCLAFRYVYATLATELGKHKKMSFLGSFKFDLIG